MQGNEQIPNSDNLEFLVRAIASNAESNRNRTAPSATAMLQVNQSHFYGSSVSPQQPTLGRVPPNNVSSATSNTGAGDEVQRKKIAQTLSLIMRTDPSNPSLVNIVNQLMQNQQTSLQNFPQQAFSGNPALKSSLGQRQIGGILNNSAVVGERNESERSTSNRLDNFPSGLVGGIQIIASPSVAFGNNTISSNIQPWNSHDQHGAQQHQLRSTKPQARPHVAAMTTPPMAHPNLTASVQSRLPGGETSAADRIIRDSSAPNMLITASSAHTKAATFPFNDPKRRTHPPGTRMVPCRARGMPMDHNFLVRIKYSFLTIKTTCAYQSVFGFY